MKILIDINVMLDSLLESRNNYKLATELLEAIGKNSKNIIYFPYHSIFEMVSALMCEDRVNTQNLKTFVKYKIGKIRDIKVKYISIDHKFLEKYFHPPYPNLKSSDMIYGLIAINGKMPLITEDIKMTKKIKDLGGKVYDIQEALKYFSIGKILE